MKDLIELALGQGFSHAAALAPAALSLRPEVRDMCAADKCRAYDRNWTCPPHCGTLEECAARLAEMKSGLLVQTVGELEDSFDFETMAETERAHLERMKQLCKERNNLYEKQNDLKGQKQQLEKALER